MWRGKGERGSHDWMMANWTRNYRIERAVNTSVKVSIASSRDSNGGEGEGKRVQKGGGGEGVVREKWWAAERERVSKRRRAGAFKCHESQFALCQKVLPIFGRLQKIALNINWNLLHNLARSLPLLRSPFVTSNLILSTFSLNIQSSRKTHYTLCKFVT